MQENQILLESKSRNAKRNQNSINIRQSWLPWILFLVGLLLYVGLASTNYDGNDIIELQAIKSGEIDRLLNPNHLLYRPLIRALYDVIRPIFQLDTPVPIAQFFVAISAAIGLGLFYVWISRFVRSSWIAIITTLAFGTSWAYWVYGISTLYFIPAVTSVLGSLVALQAIINQPDKKLALRSICLMAISTALAVLFWQANIFFVPGILLGLYLQFRKDIRLFVRTATLYMVIAVGLVLGIYLVSSYIVLSNNWSVGAFIDWIVNYANAKLASWGVLDISRVNQVPVTFASTILPIWEGFGLRDLLQGNFASVEWSRIIAIPALALAIVTPPTVLLFKRTLEPLQRNIIVLLMIGAGLYLPFIVYWDPTEPIWFIIPSIAVWSVVGILWDHVPTKFAFGVYACFIFMVAQANFTSAVWRRHAEPNAILSASTCLHENMRSDDMLVTFEYHLGDYLHFFYDNDSLSMIDVGARLDGPAASMQFLEESVQAVHARGGNVYFKSVGELENLEWLTYEVGLSGEDLARLEGPTRFNCGDANYQQLENIVDVP